MKHISQLVARADGIEAVLHKLDVVHVDVRDTKEMVREVLKCTHAMHEDMVRGFGILKRAIFTTSSRNCPTTICILDPSMMSTAELAVTNGLSKMRRLMNFASAPVSGIKEAIISATQTTYYMALVCECCFTPQYNMADALMNMSEARTSKSNPYPAAIREPNVHLASIAMYANCTLLAARAINMGLSIGRLFGIPTPSMSDKKFVEASQFLEDLSTGTIDQFPDLQAKVAQAATVGGTGVSSAGDTDYCKRQLEAFLTKVDPNKDYGGLNMVNDDEGFTYFVCRDCVVNYESPQPKR